MPASMASTGKTPVSVITGFLGSGKIDICLSLLVL
jgi:hypothetical protein